jgi:transaldolase
MPEYQFIVDKAIADNKTKFSGQELLARVLDDLLILFGLEILKIVPGRVSTETDANFSFDTAALVAKGRIVSSGFTKRTASGASACSSKSPRRGKASARRKSSSAKASTAT